MYILEPRIESSTINMVASRYANDRGHPGPRLPSAQDASGQRRQVRERIDPEGRGAGLETASAEARPEGETSACAIKGARHAPS